MKKSNLTLVIVLILISTSVYSQDFLKIKGVLFETNTNNPIYFANVCVCNESIGIASNEFGEFVLNIPKSLIEEKICISAIGYEPYSNSIKTLLKNEYNTFFLSPMCYELNEALIVEKRKRRYSNPVKILELALDNFKHNYSFDPFIIQGYYREYSKYGDENYLNLLEAGIIVDDKGFQKPYSSNQNYMLQYRYNENFNMEKTLESKYINDYNLKQKRTQKYMLEHNVPIMGGNELSILFLHDAIRRYNENAFSYINQLNKDFIPNHQFILDDIILIDNIPVYQISFKYIDNYSFRYSDHSYDHNSNIIGKIFIESNTYAIKRIEYTSYSLKNSKIKNFEIITEYQKYQGKMYLKYLSFSNSFNINTSAINFSELKLPNTKKPLRIIEANIANEFLILKFNKNLRKRSANNKRNFDLVGQITRVDHFTSEQVSYQLKKHPDDTFLADSNTLFLKIPNLNLISRNNEKISINNSTVEIDKIKVILADLKDVNGNKIDDYINITMHQFRELFVNEIQTDLTLPSFARTIFPESPLYNQKPLEVDGFWENFNYPSNVPLQNNY